MQTSDISIFLIALSIEYSKSAERTSLTVSFSAHIQLKDGDVVRTINGMVFPYFLIKNMRSSVSFLAKKQIAKSTRYHAGGYQQYMRLTDGRRCMLHRAV